MNSLNLTLTKKLKPYTDVYIDDEIVKPKKHKKLYKAEYITEKSSVELVIKSYSRFQTRWWFFIEMFFFLISIFGVFDQRFGKYCYTTHCKVNLKLQNETNVKLRIVAPRSEGPVVKVETDCEFEEVENIYHIDQKAKKRQKLLRVFKVLTFIAIVAAVVVVIVI